MWGVLKTLHRIMISVDLRLKVSLLPWPRIWQMNLILSSSILAKTLLIRSNLHQHTKIISLRLNLLPTTSVFNTICSGVVLKVLDSLKTNKAIGLDDIRARILKLTAPSINDSLAYLFNLSLTTGKIPWEWKRVRFRVIWKVHIHWPGLGKMRPGYGEILDLVSNSYKTWS